MTVLSVIHLPGGGLVGAVTRVAATATPPSASDLVGERLPVRRRGDGADGLFEVTLDAALLTVTDADPAGIDQDKLFADPTGFQVVRDAPGRPARVIAGPVLGVSDISLSSAAMTVTLAAPAPWDLPVFVWLSVPLGAAAQHPVTAVGVLKLGLATVDIAVSLTPGTWLAVAFVAGLEPFRKTATVGGPVA